MSDILSIGTPKETTEVTIYNPSTSEILMNADGTEMTVTVYGPYSKRYKQVAHAQQNRRLQRAQRTGGRVNLTAEEIEASALDLLVKCVSDWNITVGGEKPECTEAKVREIFEAVPWLKEQVDSGMMDSQAFLAK